MKNKVSATKPEPKAKGTGQEVWTRAEGTAVLEAFSELEDKNLNLKLMETWEKVKECAVSFQNL